MKSLYIHIPFCNNICSYCDFCKMFYEEKLVDKYLESLDKEIIQNYKMEELETIYIGGGTPSSLSIKQLNRLFEITNKLNIRQDNEFTMEFNIDDVCEEKLKFISKKGINRISIGIQTINSKFYKLLDRYNDYSVVREKINLCKKYFKNINIDLMYGFNNQTVDDLDVDIDFFLSLDVPHISIYSLILEEHTKLFIDKYLPIDDDLENNMYYHIIKRLKENGFKHYEISNFSKKEFCSKHNLSYWNNEHYYGFGLGASGYIYNIRYTNTKSLINYLKGNYMFDKEIIDKRLNMQYEMICGLRKTEGVSKKTFYDKFNVNIKDVFNINSLLSEGLLIENKDNIFIPEDKLYISNKILVSFLD